MKNISVRNVSFTLATTSSRVMDTLPPNSKRKSFTIMNTSTAGELVTLGHGGDAISGKGIVLYPTSSYGESRGADFEAYQHEITALGSAATATIAVHETIEVG